MSQSNEFKYVNISPEMEEQNNLNYEITTNYNKIVYCDSDNNSIFTYVNYIKNNLIANFNKDINIDPDDQVQGPNNNTILPSLKDILNKNIEFKKKFNAELKELENSFDFVYKLTNMNLVQILLANNQQLINDNIQLKDILNKYTNNKELQTDLEIYNKKFDKEYKHIDALLKEINEDTLNNVEYVGIEFLFYDSGVQVNLISYLYKKNTFFKEHNNIIINILNKYTNNNKELQDDLEMYNYNFNKQSTYIKSEYIDYLVNNYKNSFRRQYDL